MGFDPSRLRRGEWLVALSAVVLLASMFVLDWYGPTGTPSQAAGASTSSNAWNSLSNTRWLMLITIAVALALVYFQGSRRSPAIPVSLSVIVSVLAFITVLALIYRVFIDAPGNDLEAKAGAYVGLLSAIALLIGGFLSMRDEGITERDAPQKIETIRIEGARNPAGRG